MYRYIFENQRNEQMSLIANYLFRRSYGSRPRAAECEKEMQGMPPLFFKTAFDYSTP